MLYSLSFHRLIARLDIDPPGLNIHLTLDACIENSMDSP